MMVPLGTGYFIRPLPKALGRRVLRQLLPWAQLHLHYWAQAERWSWPAGTHSDTCNFDLRSALSVLLAQRNSAMSQPLGQGQTNKEHMQNKRPGKG